jgi:hypothetical protein
MPAQDPALPLTPSGTRALVAAMCRGAMPDVPPHTASTVVDAVDATSRVLLVDVLGLTPTEALTALSQLWRAR